MRLNVGYDSNLGHLEETADGPQSPVVALLQTAFPKPEYELVYRSFYRQDLDVNVAGGQIDVGVMSLGIGNSSNGEAGVVGRSRQRVMGVDMLPVPVSHAVMAVQPGIDEESYSAVLPAWLTFVLVTITALVVSAGAMAASTYLLNFHRSLPKETRNEAFKRLDPSLTHWSRAWRWMFTTLSGGLLTAVWGGIGVALAFIMHQESLGNSVRLTGVRETASAQAAKVENLANATYEFRGNYWAKCQQPFECLRHYDDGVADALLGDPDLLCWEARKTGLARPLRFTPDVAIPISVALLVSAGKKPKGPSALDSKSRLVAALRTFPGAGRLYADCAKGAKPQWSSASH